MPDDHSGLVVCRACGHADATGTFHGPPPDAEEPPPPPSEGAPAWVRERRAPEPTELGFPVYAVRGQPARAASGAWFERGWAAARRHGDVTITVSALRHVAPAAVELERL